MLAIGLMSGTCLDGIDVSLIRTDGESQLELIANYHQPYEKEFQIELKKFLNSAYNWSIIERKLTVKHAQAIATLLDQVKPCEKVEIIGFHGQTIIHKPEIGFTWQMGDPNLLAKLVKIDVIGDFRRRDMAYGGQGAPLVPVYHRALINQLEKPVLVINIGGVSNFTYIGPNEDELIAFDVGPGNALIDDLCLELFGKQYDYDGNIASNGLVDRQLVEDLLRDEYFARPPPKSLDRNHFSSHVTRLNNLNHVDKIATISYFTVASILKSIELHLPDNGG